MHAGRRPLHPVCHVLTHPSLPPQGHGPWHSTLALALSAWQPAQVAPYTSQTTLAPMQPAAPARQRPTIASGGLGHAHACLSYRQHRCRPCQCEAEARTPQPPCMPLAWHVDAGADAVTLLLHIAARRLALVDVGLVVLAANPGNDIRAEKVLPAGCVGDCVVRSRSCCCGQGF